MRFPIVICIFVSLLVRCARAWGRRGHQAIARYAFARISDNGKLYLEKMFGHPVTLAEFVEVSLWADKVSGSKEYAWSKDFHFTQNAQLLKQRSLPKDSECLLTSIDTFTNILLDLKRPSDFPPSLRGVTKKQALMFVMHFVGDLHAPFHIGDKEDQNGCEIFVDVQDTLKRKIQAYRESSGDSPRSPVKKFKLSLHSVWDSTVIDYIEMHEGKSITDQVDDELAADTPRKRRRTRNPKRPFNLRDMVLSSASKSREIMTTAGILDMEGKRIRTGHILTKAYMERSRPIILNQIIQGGKNLARTINKLADLSDV